MQSNNGVLEDQQALRLVNGLVGHVPPPNMQGLALPAALMTRTPTLAGDMPAQQKQVAPVLSNVQESGHYPPLAPEQAAAFQTAFQQLDTDHDGYVNGVDCFPAFMRSGLSKQTLKRIWDVVAGNEGRLNLHELIQVR
jgi:hypothetical protein